MLVQSNSQKVKDLFAKQLYDKNSLELKEQYSNDELIEIFNIIKNSDIKFPSLFLGNLINSQEGPFNQEVFTTYLSRLANSEALLHLLKVSKGLSEENLVKWLAYCLVIDGDWFMSKFISSGISSEYGINPLKSPFKLQILNTTSTYGRLSNKAKQIYFSILDTMSASEKMDWFKEYSKKWDASSSTMLIHDYENSTEEMLDYLFDYLPKKTSQALVYQKKIYKHKNSSDLLKTKLYELTGDESYLPTSISGMLLF